MNVSDIKTRVRSQFGDEASVQISDADILRWANDGQKEIAYENELLQTIATTNLTANTATYNLPTDIFTLISIRVDGVPIKELSHQDYDEQVQKYLTSSSIQTSRIPDFYYLFATQYNFYPTPSETITNGIKVYYRRVPAELALDADIPAIPSIYHLRLVDYIMKQCYRKDEDWTASEVISKELTEKLDRLKGHEPQRAEQYYQTITYKDDDYMEYC